MDKNFFNFLNQADQVLLGRHAEVRTYKDGQIILEQGSENASIYVIKEGDVSIASRSLGHILEIEQLHPGDLFGDMSFIDSSPTSTDIIAIGSVTIGVIDRNVIKTLIQGDPLFYGRFYHALAKLLSWRLRKINAQLEGTTFKDEKAYW